MRYRMLGGTGIEVSSQCLGTMMFGQIGNPDHDACIRMVDVALEHGINFVDTADMYSEGESEEIVGKALRGRRDGIVLATNAHFQMGEARNRSGNSRRWLVQAAEESLRRLQTDWIDLFQIHRPDPSTDIEETLSALSDLVRAGKIRTFGSSTFPADEIVDAYHVAKRHGLRRFRSEQPPYSLLLRGIERSVLPTCQRLRMGVLTWSPLAWGFLSGRYRKGQPVDLVTGRPTIDGPRTVEQLESALAAASTTLDDATLDRIDEIVPPGTDVYRNEGAWVPAPLTNPSLRRRPIEDRAAA